MAESSIAVCKRCGGDSQIENTQKQHTRYVKRTRACVACGLTWSTAEVPLADIKILKAVQGFLRLINAKSV